MIKSLPELEVMVDSIVILGNKAIVNFNSKKNRYSINTNRNIANKFEFNKKYTAFMDYKINYSINDKSSKIGYEGMLKALTCGKEFINSIREGNRNFIYTRKN